MVLSWALLLFLLGCVTAKKKPAKTAFSEGERLFHISCNLCHPLPYVEVYTYNKLKIMVEMYGRQPMGLGPEESKNLLAYFEEVKLNFPSAEISP